MRMPKRLQLIVAIDDPQFNATALARNTGSGAFRRTQQAPRADDRATGSLAVNDQGSASWNWISPPADVSEVLTIWPPRSTWTRSVPLAEPCRSEQLSRLPGISIRAGTVPDTGRGVIVPSDVPDRHSPVKATPFVPDAWITNPATAAVLAGV